MFEPTDDVFDTGHDLSDLENEATEEEDMLLISAHVVESLLEQIRIAKEELNDYHIRDAEMEGWMHIPRNRYLRLLGLDLENRDLICKNRVLEEELEDWGSPTQFIEQPPEEYPPEPDPGLVGPDFDTVSEGGWGGSSSSENDAPVEYQYKARAFDPSIIPAAGSPDFNPFDPFDPGEVKEEDPLVWRDTAMLDQKEIQTIVDEVMRKLRGGE